MFLLDFLSYMHINKLENFYLLRYDYIYVDSHGVLSTRHRYGTFRFFTVLEIHLTTYWIIL
jgi:hypothetical protein